MEIPRSVKQHIDNVSNNNLNNNVIVTETEVNLIAQKLAEQLNNPGAWEFYCKVGWKLPQATIWSNLEIALSGRDPQKYFSWLCKREMA